MTEYKLSIIVPTYNLENEIKDTFNSIKNQTLGFENIELIFVDDNSIDNTFKITTEYSNNYENVKSFKTDTNSKFAGKPRNIGLEKSTSKYVLFLDGDDHLLINSCEILLDNITSNDGDISIGAHINHYDNQVQEHNPPLYSGRNEVFENSNDINLLSITPAISAKLFSKDLLIENNIKFIEGIPGQDLLFLVEVLLNSRKVNVLNNNYIYYRHINNNSVSLNPNEDYIYGLIKAYSILCDLFEEFSIDFNVQLAILQRHLGFFSMQILRAYNTKKITAESLREIFNSKSFVDFMNKSLFKNNEDFLGYFKLLNEGNYGNARIKINSIDSKFNTINDYSNLKNEINLLNDKQKRLSEEISSLEEQTSQQTNKIKTLTDNNNTLKEQNTQQTNKIKTLTDNNNTLKEQNTQLNDEIKSNQKNIGELRTLRNNLVTENKIIIKNNTSLKEQKEKLINKNKNIAKQNKTLINNNVKLKEENITVNSKNKMLEEENKNITKENEFITNSNITLKKQNDRLTEQNNNLNNDFVDLKQEFDDIKIESEKIINSNTYLKEENSNLKIELNEIKSSRLWKLKSKF